MFTHVCTHKTNTQTGKSHIQLVQCTGKCRRDRRLWKVRGQAIRFTKWQRDLVLKQGGKAGTTIWRLSSDLCMRMIVCANLCPYTRTKERKVQRFPVEHWRQQACVPCCTSRATSRTCGSLGTHWRSQHFFFFFFETEAHYVALTRLCRLVRPCIQRDLPASASWVLGLKVCATTPSFSRYSTVCRIFGPFDYW